MRDYWRGEPARSASSPTGSPAAPTSTSDGRRPYASINFVTAHDGFTLRDLVSYNEKHNEANGEDNQDGEIHNRSWNCGVEGPTDDPEVNALRAPPAAQLPGHAVPLAGRADAAGRATRSAARSTATTTPTARTTRSPGSTGRPSTPSCSSSRAALIALRAAPPGLPPAALVPGPAHLRQRARHRLVDARRQRDVRRATGRRHAKSLGVFLNGDGIDARRAREQRIVDDTFLLLFNAHHEPIDAPGVKRWGEIVGARLLDLRPRQRRREPRRAVTPTSCRDRSVGGRCCGGGSPREVRSRPRPPRATYRLQLHAGLRLRRRRRRSADYLADLGVSHLYLSPVLQAAPGSTHGYDVVDHARSTTSWAAPRPTPALCAALGAARPGPGARHRAQPHGDRRRRRTAGGGTCSRTARQPLRRPLRRRLGPARAEKLRNTVLLPVLGDHYGRVLEAASWPRSATGRPSRSATSTTPAGGAATLDGARAGRPPAGRLRRAGLHRRRRFRAPAAGHRAPTGPRWPSATATRRVLRQPPAGWLLGRRPHASARRRRAGWPRSTPTSTPSTRCSSARTTGSPTGGRPAEEPRLPRFFDINTWSACASRTPRSSDDTHELVLRWCADGRGRRGCASTTPTACATPRVPRAPPAAPAADGGDLDRGVEKILAGRGAARRRGRSPAPPATTSQPVGGLFVDPPARRPLTAGSTASSPASRPTGDEVVVEAKALLRRDPGRRRGPADALLVDVCERRPHHRDRTRHELAEALRELLVSFPVYRTYVRADVPGRPPAPTTARVEAAVADGRARRDDIDPGLLEFLAGCCCRGSTPRRPLEHEFAMRFQQLTGPVMAKGVEDTGLLPLQPAAWRSTRWAATRPVRRAGRRVPRRQRRACERWPATMTTCRPTTPSAARTCGPGWRCCRRCPRPGARRAAVDGGLGQSRWPGGERRPPHPVPALPDAGRGVADRRRAGGGATWPRRRRRPRSAPRGPSPTPPTTPPATPGSRPCSPTRAGRRGRGFAVARWRRGWVNALAQAAGADRAGRARRLPGQPSWWDLSLVDPDNRRPVDFALRRALLAEWAPPPRPETLLARADEGLPKLRVTRDALHLRRRRPGGVRRRARPAPTGRSGGPAPRPTTWWPSPGAATAAVVVPRLVLGWRRRRRAAAVTGGPAADRAGRDRTRPRRVRRHAGRPAGLARPGDRRPVGRRRGAGPTCSPASPGGCPGSLRADVAATVFVSVWAPRAAVGRGRAARRGGDAAPAQRPRRAGGPATCPTRRPGDYRFSLDGGPPAARPRSRWQPHGVHGPSRVVDHGAFAWTDGGWRRRRPARRRALRAARRHVLRRGTFDGADRPPRPPGRPRASTPSS